MPWNFCALMAIALCIGHGSVDVTMLIIVFPLHLDQGCVL